MNKINYVIFLSTFSPFIPRTGYAAARSGVGISTTGFVIKPEDRKYNSKRGLLWYEEG
jgi:hypothetical protein